MAIPYHIKQKFDAELGRERHRNHISDIWKLTSAAFSSWYGNLTLAEERYKKTNPEERDIEIITDPNIYADYIDFTIHITNLWFLVLPYLNEDVLDKEKEKINAKAENRKPYKDFTELILSLFKHYADKQVIIRTVLTMANTVGPFLPLTDSIKIKGGGLE